jgi:UDP-N-acetyl-D-galactosamine dehydrogenase
LLRRRGRGGVVTRITFKENIPDIRNSRVIDIVRELKSLGVTVQIADPLADVAAVEEEYGVTLTGLNALQPADAVILALRMSNISRVAGRWFGGS